MSADVEILQATVLEVRGPAYPLPYTFQRRVREVARKHGIPNVRRFVIVNAEAPRDGVQRFEVRVFYPGASS